MYISKHNCTNLKLIARLLLVLPVIWFGAWLCHQPSSGCQNKRELGVPLVVIGSLLLMFNLAQLVLWFFLRKEESDQQAAEDCLDNTDRTNLVQLFDYIGCWVNVFFLVLSLYSVFLLINTTGGRGVADHYPRRLAGKVNHNWLKIKHCLVSDNKVCSPFLDHLYEGETNKQPKYRHFSSIQNGCCKPPRECNFTYISPSILWSRPSDGATLFADNPDCGEWSNDPNTLCFNCQSCKDGFFHDLRETGKDAGIGILVVILLFVLLACCPCCREASPQRASKVDQLLFGSNV